MSDGAGDSDDRAARAILARYDIHLRADEPLTPALHRVAGQLKARNLPRPGSVEHTAAGGHTFRGSASAADDDTPPPPPVQDVAAAWSSMERAEGDGDDAAGVEALPPPPPPPDALLDGQRQQAAAGPEEPVCAAEAGVDEAKTTDVRAGRARRASTGRVPSRGRGGSSRASQGEEGAGAAAAEAAAGEGEQSDSWDTPDWVECPDRERPLHAAPVGAPAVGEGDAGGAEDELPAAAAGYCADRDYKADLVAGKVLPPSVGGAAAGVDADAAAAGSGSSGFAEGGGSEATAAMAKWQRGEWLCELRETRKRGGGVIDYLFDITAPSVGEEWARRWTVTKRFADFQTLDACVRALYPEGCEPLPHIPKRRFSIGGFSEITEGLGDKMGASLGMSMPSVPSFGKGPSAATIDERTKLLSGWALCALSLAHEGGPLGECEEIKEFFAPEGADSGRLHAQQQQQQAAGSVPAPSSAAAAAGDGGAGGAPGAGAEGGESQSQRRGSIGDALSSGFSKLGSFRRGSSSGGDGDGDGDGESLPLPPIASSGGDGMDGRRGSIGDRAMAALESVSLPGRRGSFGEALSGVSLASLRGSMKGGGGQQEAPPAVGVVGVASVEEWAVLGVALRARHNTALTAACDAPVIPGTTIPAPAVATGELTAGESAGDVLEVGYSDGGSQLRVRLEGGWASVFAKDGTQLLEPQPRV